MANGNDPNEALLDALASHTARTAWKQVGAFVAAFGLAILGAAFYLGRQDERVEDAARNSKFAAEHVQETRHILVRIETKVNDIEGHVDELEEAQRGTSARVEELARKVERRR